jgi:hypothetical protein
MARAFAPVVIVMLIDPTGAHHTAKCERPSQQKGRFFNANKAQMYAKHANGPERITDGLPFDRFPAGTT